MTGHALQTQGHGDWALQGADGVFRKVLGTSLRQRRHDATYLGVVLLRDAVPLMERYLPMPSRQPGYRADRGHRDFCTHLGCSAKQQQELQRHLAVACEHLVCQSKSG